MAGQAVFLPIAVFFWQIVGAARTFRPPEGSRGSPLIQVISIGFVALIVGVAPEPVNTLRLVTGCVGLSGAIVLFEWARHTARGLRFGYIFANETPTFVCTSGPFAYIRNPFYTSYLMTMGSTVVMFPNTFRAVVFVAMVVYFTAAAVQEERAFSRSAVAEEYEKYKARTGRFLPKLTR